MTAIIQIGVSAPKPSHLHARPASKDLQGVTGSERVQHLRRDSSPSDPTYLLLGLALLLGIALVVATFDSRSTSKGKTP